MMHFREYSDAMKINIANQVKAQAKEGGDVSLWVRALEELNPELNAYPNHPALVVGEAVILVRAAQQPRKQTRETAGGGRPSVTTGAFSVKYGDRQEKPFTDYHEAREFYDSIDGEAALWDYCRGLGELCHLKEVV